MRTRITFTGDLLAYRSLIQKSNKGKGHDFSSVFADARSLFDESDYVVGNLETPLAGKGAGYTVMDMLFNTPDSFARDAKNAGFNMFTTANNHCMDKGEDGLKRTLDVLDEMGIDHTGTFRSNKEKRFIVKDINGIKFSFVSFTYGTNPNVNGYEINEGNDYLVNLIKHPDEVYKRPFIKQVIVNILYRLPLRVQNAIHPLYPAHGFDDNVPAKEIGNIQNKKYEDNFIEIIKAAKRESDIVIVCLHSGGQFNSKVGEYTNYLIDMVRKQSVDVLIVNHPHCVLGSKWDKNVFEAYALGNFCFTPEEGYFIDGVYGEYGVVLNLDYDTEEKKLIDVSFSVIKNVRSHDGKERVVPVSELYKELTSEGQELLLRDVKQVICRFVGRDVENAILERYSHSKL